MSNAQNQESKNLEHTMNALLQERNQAKQNSLTPIGTGKTCGCTTKENSTGQKVDLIVLIDTSSSMKTAGRIIDDDEVVENAISEAKRKCNPDLEITYLGLDTFASENSTPTQEFWLGTIFEQSHRDYIEANNGTVPLATDQNYVGYKPEQGANAIQDLSKYAKWREGACRAIFYISDEELDGSSPRGDELNEAAATEAAIAEANANNVTVFTHHLNDLGEAVKQNYRDLCNQTGGEAYFSNTPDSREYVKLLSEAICYACGKCKDITFPDIKPCISIKWGDSDCDCIESSDYEVMSLTICNCYNNVVFQNYSITMIEVLDAEGNPVPTLPNGSPSVNIHPIGVYCFGDIEPCSCVSREFVIINEGAKAGTYHIVLKGISFDVVQTYGEVSTSFAIEICKD